MITFRYRGVYTDSHCDEYKCGRLSDDVVQRLIGECPYPDLTSLAADRCLGEEDADGLMTFHAKVYSLAEEYGMPKLKQDAVDKFSLLRGFSVEDMCAAILVIQKTVPEHEQALKKVAIWQAAEKFDEIAKADNYDHVVRHTPEFLTAIALQQHGQLAAIKGKGKTRR